METHEKPEAFVHEPGRIFAAREVSVEALNVLAAELMAAGEEVDAAKLRLEVAHDDRSACKPREVLQAVQVHNGCEEESRMALNADERELYQKISDESKTPAIAYQTFLLTLMLYRYDKMSTPFGSPTEEFAKLGVAAFSDVNEHVDSLGHIAADDIRS